MRHPSTIERDYASSSASVPASGPAMVYSLDTIAAAYEAAEAYRAACASTDATAVAALEAYYFALGRLLERVLDDTGLTETT